MYKSLLIILLLFFYSTAQGKIDTNDLIILEQNSTGDIVIGKYKKNKQITVNGKTITLAKNKKIYFYNDHINVATLAFPQIINTPLGEMEFEGMIYLEEGGNFTGGDLKTPAEVKTTYGTYLINGIGFYPSGELNRIIPSKPASINIGDYTFDFEILSLEKNGDFRGAVLSNPQLFKTKAGEFLFGKDWVNFHSNGQLQNATLHKPAQLATFFGSLQIQGTLFFYDNGMFDSCILRDPQKGKTPLGPVNISSFHLKPSGIGGYIELAEPISHIVKGRTYFFDALSFDNDGKFYGGGFYHPLIINTPQGELPAQYLIFYPNENLKCLMLASTIEIEGMEYSSYVYIGWNSSGEFLGKVEYNDNTDTWHKID